MTELTAHKIYGMIALGILGAALLFLVVLGPRLGYSALYGDTYFRLGVVSFLLMAVFAVVAWSNVDGAESTYEQVFYVSDEDETKPLSGSPWYGVGAAVAVAIALFFTITKNGLALYAIPNAFGGTLSYSSEAMMATATASTYFLSSVIPGLFEEAAIFALIRILTLVGIAVTALFVRDAWDNPAVRWTWVITLSAVGAGYFSYAHAVYMGNEAAYVWAFIFEFSMQILNELSGSWVSWIPHIAHNAAVLSVATLGIAPLSAAVLAGFILFRVANKPKKPVKHSVRRWDYPLERLLGRPSGVSHE